MHLVRVWAVPEISGFGSGGFRVEGSFKRSWLPLNLKGFLSKAVGGDLCGILKLYKYTAGVHSDPVAVSRSQSPKP